MRPAEMRSSIAGHRGFSLIELVAVIVLLSILGIGAIGLFRIGTEGYLDTVRRGDLAQLGRWSVERLSRELRNALPASVRVLGSAPGAQCLEFVPIEAASRYLDLPTTATASSFEAVNFALGAVSAAHRVVVYALDETHVYAAGSTRNHALDSLGAPASGQRTVGFATPVSFATGSPSRRFFVVGAPVAFCVSGGDLTRHSGYGVIESHGALPPAGGSSALIAEHVIQSEGGSSIDVFDYRPGNLQRGGIVDLDLRFATAEAPEEIIRFSHTVAVRNAP